MSPSYFKGMPQMRGYRDYSSSTVRNYGIGLYKYASAGQGSGSPQQILNTTEGNVTPGTSKPVTADIYQIGYHTRDSSGEYHASCYPIGDIPITNVTLGTGDGTKDKFYIPHENASNITCSVTGYTIEETQVSEVTPLYQYDAVGDIFNKKRNDYYGGAVYTTKGEWIPYKQGYFHGNLWMQSEHMLYGIYIYYDSATQQYYCNPERINCPNLTMESDPLALWIAPDKSCVTVIMADSSANPSYLKSYIIDYDYTTGTFGNILYTSTTRPMFTQDMTRLVEVKGIGSNSFFSICVSTFVRTNSAITPTLEFTVNTAVTNGSAKCSPQGKSYIMDGIVKVSGGTCKTYKLDIPNKTGAILQYTGFDSGLCTPNYAASFASNILTIYNVVGGVATQVYTKDCSDTQFVSKSLVIKSLVEYNNRLYVMFAYAGQYSYGTAMIILAKDTDGNWYIVNEQTYGYATPTDGKQSSVGGLTVSEMVINNTYTVVDNAVDFESGTSGGGSYTSAQYRSSLDAPCIRRKKGIRLKFATPPASGTAVVVGYHLDYFPKDTNWILATTPTVAFSRPS
jgi:hypothetical protein